MLGHLVFARHLACCFEFNKVDAAWYDDDAVRYRAVTGANELAALPAILFAALDQARFDVAFEFL